MAWQVAGNKAVGVMRELLTRRVDAQERKKAKHHADCGGRDEAPSPHSLLSISWGNTRIPLV
jgi:hypothetical protein